MSREASRRKFLSGTAAAIASIVGGAGAASATSSASEASATSAASATVPDGPSIGVGRTDDFETMRVAAQSFANKGLDGKIPKRLNYDGPNWGIEEINTIVWCEGWGLMKSSREDARWGGMVEPDPDIPELAVHNEINFSLPDPPKGRPPRYTPSYDADVHQKLLFSESREALLIDGAVDVPGPNTEDFNHTVYTHWKPDFGFPAEGFVKSRNGYDVIAMTCENEPYIAYANTFQTESGDVSRSFDGQRIGDGETDKSAWTDIYEEADGWIDSNQQNERGERDYDESKLDFGVGRYIGTDAKLRWTGAFGFGDSWEAAADAAVDSLDAGYEAERSAWL